MTDKPILFSAPMIRALLAGRKTQTRRVLKPQPVQNDAGLWVFPPKWDAKGFAKWGFACQSDEAGLRSHLEDERARAGLPIAPGDRLYVREACATWEGDHRDVVYRDDLSDKDWSDLSHDARNGAPWKLRPSIHMPRWASRLTLTVTDVRVQRLQEISEADAIAEGVPPDREGAGTFIGRQGPGRWVTPWPTATEAFADLWNSLHGPDAWASNPWVTAISFDVHRCNIDRMETAEGEA